ncbi:C40 family peptidase [Pectinatus sottacetonis]|uniref:C40 family peptidase n=1 Tax=Pectinatus sottacetonis TaxID=1002795 RepID=UPI0018C806D6|nr:NlpC/P60 family protein [Pectinatus sottacetonis]
MNKPPKLIHILFIFTIIFYLGGTAAAAPILSLHSEGREVILLQQMLKEHHYDIKITGIFDNSTQAAVKAFQKNNALEVTGVTNRKTWWTLTGKKLSPGFPTPHITPPPTAIKPVIKPRILVPTINKHRSPSQPQQNPATIIAGIRTQKVSQTPPFVPSQKVSQIISTAKKYMGVPYVYGGETPKGFDCSGYLQYVFKKNNIILPRTADKQYELGKTVPVKKLERGDLVFFATDLKEISHCGIYLGNDEFIHASSSHGVRIDRLDNSYWQTYFVGGKHIVH